MADPRITGISGITGKVVTIRHANDMDRVIIEEYMRQGSADFDLTNADVVVAAENERIIGFGILKRENDAGCVSLFEDSRRRGIGSTIVNHLLKFAAVRRVYAARYASYFTRSNSAWLKKIHSERAKNTSRRRMPLMERLPLTTGKNP